jgi:hypothetical protein
MKKISCNSIGGPADCSEVVEAVTEEDAIQKWHGHFGSTHPEIVANVSDEDKKKWMDAHHQVWEAAPEA